MRRSFKGQLRLNVAAIAVIAAATAHPAFAQTAASTTATDPVAAEPAAPDIVVTGSRQAQRKAIAQKKLSNTLVETLYANDVGKLPDQNVAEAVRRLPGVSVANDQGEGRYVIIRGIAPNLVNVVLNGQTLPAPEPDSRQVKLDDIPSAMIQSVTVSKSLSADQEGSAIGGEVNIRTLTAFDRDKSFFVDARGAYGLYRKNQKSPYEGDIIVGGRYRDFGAVVSVNYSRRPIESENFQGSTVFYAANGGPDQFGLRDYNLVRERVGVVGNFDWRPSDAVKVFVKTSYSYFSDDEVRDQNRADQLAYTPASASSGTFLGRGSLLVRRRVERDNTKSVELGGEFVLPHDVKLEAAGTFTRAIKNDPLRSEFNFRGAANSAAGTFDLTRSPYGFAFTNFPPANYSLNSVNYDIRHAQDDLYQVRVDATVPIMAASALKFGGKYRQEIKTNNRDFQQFGRAAAFPFTGANASFVGNTSFYGSAYVFGPRVDYDAAQAYAAARPGTLTQTAANLQSSRANSQVNDYYIREQVYAGYAMATFKFGNVTIIPGVRVEHTTDYAAGKLLTTASPIDQDFNSFNSTSYTDFLPGLNARLDVTPQLVVRAAATTAIGRPNYPDLTPYISIDQTAAPTAITLGNPGIRHYKAVNLDADIEFYPARDSLFSAGIFYKHIDNPIYTQTQTLNNVTYAGQTFATALVTQALNAETAYVLGFEANAQTQFTSLPGLLSGLGVSANYTHITGEGTNLPNRRGELPLFLQSRDIGTAQIFYEKYGFALRVAYSYRSSYLDTIGATAAADQFTDSNGQIDVHISYQPTPNVTLFADGSNLNNAANRRYLGGNHAQLIEREQHDLSIRGGVQLHF